MSFSFNFNIGGEDAASPGLTEGDGAAADAATTAEMAKAGDAAESPGNGETEGSACRLLDLDSSGVDTKFASTFSTVPSTSITFNRIDPERIVLPEEFVAAMTSSVSTSDLVPGVYEGGLRVWEGSLDLVAHMATHPELLRSGTRRRRKRPRPRRCLELGCGHGFPGIYVLQQQQQQQQQQADAPWSVCFSDFNEEVLVSVTWPNVLMNTTADTRFRASYLAGDWKSLRPVAEGITADADSGTAAGDDEHDVEALLAEIDPEGSNREATAESTDVAEVGLNATTRDDEGIFDLILTAETCYTQQSCREVAHLVADLLRAHVRAVALVATKRFYFGTGGSASYFREIAQSHGLHVTVAEVIDDGRSNIREIIEVRRRPVS